MIEITQNIAYQNYDLAFKEALTIFENQTLDFLGLNLPKITGVLATEFAEVETRDEFVDLLFWLEDGTILHIEEQNVLSTEDLIRFAQYVLRIFKRHRVPVHTVVLSPASASTEGTRGFDMGSLQYSVTHIVIRDRNADEVLEQVRKELSAGRPIHEIELIFVPLMESRLSIEDLLLETIKLEKEIENEAIRSKVIALTLVLSNKLVEPELLGKIWEDVKMLKILKFAEDKGKEQGLQLGIQLGIQQGKIEEKRLLVERLLVKKFGQLSKDTLDQIQNMDNMVLDQLSFEILDFQSALDLERFIQKMNLR